MLSFNAILILSLFYLSLLFGIAYLGDSLRFADKFKPIVYSLGLGVYCTSWAFYGVTGRAAETGWWMAPTYTGAIMVYLLAWPLMKRIAQICNTSKITSVADFIARRYGQSSSLAGLITLVSVVALVPYMALQIRAIETSFTAIQTGAELDTPLVDSAFIFTFILAVFAVLFGTRRLRSSEHNPGLMLAIAFESLVKLGTMLLLGIFVCFFMFDGLTDLVTQAQQAELPKVNELPSAYVYIVQVLIGVLMMFCLPRQFHTSFVENNNPQELKVSRWLFPAYLIGMGIFALPLANAGNLLFEGQNIPPDSYLLQLPINAQNEFMALMGFIGGFSAATSMVIVTSIVLSIMVSNEVVTPWLLKRERRNVAANRLSPSQLINVRRITIIVMFCLAYGYHVMTQNFGLLANTGLMAMSLLAQFSPALLLGMFWQQANQKAAYVGITTGALVWLYTLFTPTLLSATGYGQVFLESGPLGISWLAPTALFGAELEFIAHGVLFSLASNVGLFVYFSWVGRPEFAEKLQRARFLPNKPDISPTAQANISLRVSDVEELMARFMGPHDATTAIQKNPHTSNLLANAIAPPALLQQAQDELSAIIGGPSAQLVIDSAQRDQESILPNVVELVDEASEVLKFNRSLLQSTLQNIDQGIAVVDKTLRIVAWNRRYLEMFDYPDGEIFIGRPVAEVIRFNGERGLIADDDVDNAVNKRMALLEKGKPYKYQRLQANGRVIEINGNPLPGGGFVTTYTDITEFVETQKTLEEVNLLLEQRVAQRTQALTESNLNLEQAKKQAELANQNKTRYFAAVSHDLLQPINAAMLFSSVLAEKATQAELNELSGNIKQSLENAEQLLSSVLELTKLDAGVVQVEVKEFAIHDVLLPIIDEYDLALKDKGLNFTHQVENLGVRSDPKLLRRIVQNLMSNAAKYTPSGSISLLTEQDGNNFILRVEDTGPGIKEDDQARIFDDFVQLQPGLQSEGLGLGLAVVSRICKILGHTLTLNSKMGEGSVFSLALPQVKTFQTTAANTTATPVNVRDLEGIRVLVIDNDPQVLKAMQARLQEWGCDVSLAANLPETITALGEAEQDVFIVDYHLDDGLTGLDLLSTLSQDFELPNVIINSADHNMSIREQISEAGFAFLTKPTKPAALKRLMKRYMKATS